MQQNSRAETESISLLDIDKRMVCLFAGAGGTGLGLKAGGSYRPVLLCEAMPEAIAVLKAQMPNVPLSTDVTQLMPEDIPAAELWEAGFPCQDVSLAGPQQGLEGKRSSLVRHVFRLLDGVKGQPNEPRHVLLENVFNILRLKHGEIVKLLENEFSARNWRWAWRILDPRSFGVPQRRLRFFFLASRTIDPAEILFPDDEDVDASIKEGPSCGAEGAGCWGFSWSEGRIGAGWTRDSVPPVRTTVQPAVWVRSTGTIGTPAIEDLERLQGFPAGWTEVAGKWGNRLRLVGNASGAGSAEWIGAGLAGRRKTGPVPADRKYSVLGKGRMASAAMGGPEGRIFVRAGHFPCGVHYQPLLGFLSKRLVKLSKRAAAGFLSRAKEGRVSTWPPEFLEALEEWTAPDAVAAA